MCVLRCLFSRISRKIVIPGLNSRRLFACFSVDEVQRLCVWCPVCHVIDNSHCVCVCVYLWFGNVDEVVIDTPPPRAHTRTHRLSKYKESCMRHQLLLALWSHPILRHLANLSSKTQGKTKGSLFVSSLFPFLLFLQLLCGSTWELGSISRKTEKVCQWTTFHMQTGMCRD